MSCFPRSRSFRCFSVAWGLIGPVKPPRRTIAGACSDAWPCAFEARFALAPLACTSQSKLWLYVVAALAMLLCAGSALLSWNQWKALGAQRPSGEGGTHPRRSFMAIGGVVLGAGCFLIT